MKKVFNILYLVASFIFIGYLLQPAPKMPAVLPNSVKSTEPADLEELTRVGFYTDLSREEVIAYYLEQFKSNLPTIRLRDYPPEEAQTLIRDQTQSTFLEELTHPFRESLFVNGYKPSEDKNPLVVEGKRWQQKIIIRYVKSNVVVRLALGIISLILFYIVFLSYQRLFVFFKRD